MKEYQTHYFEDSGSGRKKMQKFLDAQASLGWKLSSSQISQEGYNALKTAFLGKIFLPLALLGKKKNSIQVIMERDADDNNRRYEEPQSPVDRALNQLPTDLPYVRSHLKAYVVMGVIILVVLCVIAVLSSGSSSSSTSSQSASPAPTKVVVKPTAIPINSPQVKAYKAKVEPIIDQFIAEDVLIDNDKSNLPHASDPVYINADRVYRNIDKELETGSDITVPDEYSGFHTFLDWIASTMADSMDEMVKTDGTSISGWAAVGFKTAEDDIQIAKQFKPTILCSYNDREYQGYGCKIDDLKKVATGQL